MFDVIVIGGGIIGGSIFRELTKYNCKVLLLEKENDVSGGASKANSSIVHCGYDPEEDTLMAKLNARGSQMYEEICKAISIPYKKNGALVLAYNEEDMKMLQVLLKRGITNGVSNGIFLSKEDVYVKEPNLSDGIIGALFFPDSAIIGVFEYTIGICESGVINGGVLITNSEVIGIEKERDEFAVKTKKECYRGRYIINAAGIFADRIHNMVAKPSYKIIPNKGEYYVLDKTFLTTSTIFQCPTKEGKGVLITPTVHGNILIGPDSESILDKLNIDNHSTSLQTVKEKAKKISEKIDYTKVIRNYAGIRAYSDRNDFIIEFAKDVDNFIDVAGIKSPGVASAPAIGEMVSAMILEKEHFDKNLNFTPYREQIYFNSMSIEEKNKLIKKDKSYGRVICRCESITEGEIVEAINRPVGAVSLDGIKRRCRPGLGRCQGGFCGPKVLEILARELKKDAREINLDRDNSNILI